MLSVLTARELILTLWAAVDRLKEPLEVFFAELEGELGALGLKDVADGGRAAEEDGHPPLAVVVQLPKHLREGRRRGEGRGGGEGGGTT